MPAVLTQDARLGVGQLGTFQLGGYTTAFYGPATSPSTASLGVSASASGVIDPLPVYNATAGYKVLFVNRSGVPYAEMPNALVRNVTWELNGLGHCEFEIPVTDPQASQVQVLTREVQIWRYNQLIWWGVPVRAEADRRTVKVQCMGLLWYFSRLLFGPIQNNYLLNPDFELGLTNWTATNATATTTTSVVLTGTTAAKLTTAASTAPFTDSYLSQQIVVSGNNNQTVTYFVKGWYYIDTSVTPSTNPALGQRGIFVNRIAPGNIVEATSFTPITNGSPSNSWQRIQTQIVVAAGTTRTLEIRLYSPGGVIYWDDVSVTVQESTGSNVPNSDATVIVQNVVNYAQDPARAKVSLNIAFNGPLSGQLLERHYQFYNHANIFSALQEFPAINALDFEVVWNPAGTSRTFTVYPPRKGSTKTGYPIETNRNVTDFRFKIDGQSTASQVRVLGQGGGGSSQEVGSAVDTSLTGGVLLDAAQSAPIETPVGGLNLRASQELARMKAPMKLPTVSIKDEDWFRNVKVGDTVPVTISYGWVNEVNVNYRVVNITLRPADESLDVGLQAP